MWQKRMSLNSPALSLSRLATPSFTSDTLPPSSKENHCCWRTFYQGQICYNGTTTSIPQSSQSTSQPHTSLRNPFSINTYHTFSESLIYTVRRHKILPFPFSRTEATNSIWRSPTACLKVFKASCKTQVPQICMVPNSPSVRQSIASMFALPDWLFLVAW